jgi:hypothetical protein
MTSPILSEASESAWTLKKAVTTLAIAPQTESLTRTGRMAYNLMIFKAQRMVPDEEGGYSAPLSEIIKGFDSTTRITTRVRGYIEQMCTTLVRWYPLSRSDEPQATLAGMEAPAPATNSAPPDGRVFTLMSEARFWRRSGEQWVTWFFPPTIRDMVIEPSRWAQLDIKEMATLSTYASVALYEICARYKDVPGGLTNRADTQFWVQVLKPDPDTKPREWRKFKNETIKPAIAQINQLTSIEVELLEERRGRAVVSAQFKVRRREQARSQDLVDVGLVEQGAALGIHERDLDQLMDEHGRESVRSVLEAIAQRLRAQPTVPIKRPLAYLRRALKNGEMDSLFDQKSVDVSPPKPEVPSGVQPPQVAGQVDREMAEAWLAQRRKELNEQLDALSPVELERYADEVRDSLAEKGLLTPAMQKRFDAKQYRLPMIWEYIRAAYAEERFGPAWNVPAHSG